MPVTTSPMRGSDDKRAALRARLRAVADQNESAQRFRQHVNPYVARTLEGLGIDVAFVRGDGTRLYDADGKAYLDFAGAYGALPFGHNPPEIWEAIDEIRQSAEPSLTQPSVLAAAALLAERLASVAPGTLTQVWLCNSGAEAVEAAIKLARAATRRPLVLATRNSFHGKTLGALSATGRPRYQVPFGAPVPGFAHVPFGDADALAKAFAEDGERMAAFLVEPIQGEGGIVPAPEGYLETARELCTRHGVRLVLDEVQTGLGRTGRLFACEHTAVVPDIMPLAKALGGGIVPIGAVLFDEASASEDFGLRHTSTFGGNAFCSRVGLRSLELLTADGQALVRQAARRGERLLADLRQLAAAHPRLISDVRGRGLLLGVELSDDPDIHPYQGLFRSVADQGGLAAFLCGFLLCNEGIRLAPTYFANSVLRVEPPLTVSEADCGSLVTALDRGLEIIEKGDSRRFFGHLVPAGRPVRPGPPRSRLSSAIRTGVPPRPRDGEPRWAFLAHPTDLASYESYDRRLDLAGDDVRVLFDRMNQCRNPDTPAALYVGAVRVHTDTEETSYGEVFALPYGARRLLDMPTARAVGLVQQAVDEAVGRGAQLVGLGAYTSVITANATALRDPGVPITTGNAYTVAIAVDGLERAAELQGIDLAHAQTAVIGAGGAIGRACTLLLAEKAGHLVLVGNPANPARSRRRLAATAADVVTHLTGSAVGQGPLARAVRLRAADGSQPQEIAASLAVDGLLTCSLDISHVLPRSNLVLAATSTPDQIIRPDLVRRNAAVCDVSQPPNVVPEFTQARPDVRVVQGGLVELPGRRDLGVAFGVPDGVTYACTAETMIIAHRLGDPVVSCGEQLSVDLVRLLRAEADRLGFRLYVPAQAEGS